VGGCDRNTASTGGVGPVVESRSPEAELVQRAQATLRGGVGFDAAATEFRNVYVVEGNAVCGEINWTDASGKLRGFVPFIYRYGIEVKDDDDLRSARFAQAWQRLCEGRTVTFGDRAPLPEHQREAFAQRLQALQIAGGTEQPSPYHGFYWKNLDQIETDLDDTAAKATEAKSAQDNVESADLVNELREAATTR
jgi:hypothetical protein